MLDAELDLLVVQGTVVSAEHVSHDPARQPLNLKKFIREFDLPVIVGGCASYSTALHLMRTGAVGVLVGVGPGHACTTPRRARHRRAAGDRDRRRGRRPHPPPRRDRRVRAGHRRRRHATGGDIAKAIACGADAVMIGSPLAGAYEAPGRGYHWGMATFHPTLPRGARVNAGQKGTLAEILVGPAHDNDGSFNLFGGAAHLDGHDRLRDGEGIPEGRSDGRAVAADRGQVAPAVAGRRHGPMTAFTDPPVAIR